MIAVQDHINEIEAAKDIQALEVFHAKVLGKQGSLTQSFIELKKASPEEKKEKGAALSQAKKDIQAAYDAKMYAFNVIEVNKKLSEDIVDISLEPTSIDNGHYGLLVKTRREIEEICQQMGCIVEYGHNVVTKYENFEAVNIPLTHPATEMHDTIFLEQEDDSGENLILRTQTSAIQNGLMKKYGVPLKAIVPGKVYRYEDLDASHDTVFYQLEGMVIDKGVSVAHAKDFLTKLLSSIFKFDVEVRMRPAYFPFVEPGFEIDATCPICEGNGCNLCKKTGWIEILGAGMIHPQVLREGGVDPEEYSGFAFGIGINRVVAIKYGIQDIRLFTNGDLRFVKSFD